MKRFKNILAVHSDLVGGDNAMTQAGALAQRNDVRLTVIEVLKDAAASPAYLNERQKHLSRVAAATGQDGIKVTTTVSIGTPFLHIIP